MFRPGAWCNSIGFAMTVICPSCNARFRDPPVEIPKTRPLQCGKCDHEWVPADEEAKTAQSAIDQGIRASVDAPPTQPAMNDLIADRKNAIETSLPVLIPGETVKDAPSNKAIDMPVREPLFVDREPEPTPARSWVGAVSATGIACVALMTAIVALKAQVMHNVPQTRALYELVGLVSPNDGLEIANVKTRKTKLDGIGRLIVQGEIENVAAHSIPVPPITLTMRDKKSNKLYAWTVAPQKKNLKPGERSGFTATASDFPAQAVDVEVKFADNKDRM